MPEETIAVLVERIDGLKGMMTELRDEVRDLKQNFVTKEEFGPIKMSVYGFWAIIGVAVIGGLVALLIG